MSDNLEQRLRALEAKLLMNQKDTWTRVLLGRVLLQAGRVADAHAAFTRVLADEPKNADGHHGLGRVRAAEGDHRGALLAYNQALSCDPNHVAAHAELIQHHEGRGEHTMATPHFTAVLRTKGEDVDWLRRAADNLVTVGNDAEALPLLERAQRKNTADNEIALRLGLCYARLGRYLEGRDVLRPLCLPKDCPKAGLVGLGMA
jgi:Flp pilus assembly protein TadD